MNSRCQTGLKRCPLDFSNIPKIAKLLTWFPAAFPKYLYAANILCSMAYFFPSHLHGMRMNEWNLHKITWARFCGAFFWKLLGNRNSLFLALPRLSVPNISTLKSSKHVPHRAFAPVGKTGKIQSQMGSLVRQPPFPSICFLSADIKSHRILVETAGLSSDEQTHGIKVILTFHLADLLCWTLLSNKVIYIKGSRGGSCLTGLDCVGVEVTVTRYDEQSKTK